MAFFEFFLMNTIMYTYKVKDRQYVCVSQRQWYSKIKAQICQRNNEEYFSFYFIAAVSENVHFWQ